MIWAFHTSSNSSLSLLFNSAKEHHMPPTFIFKPQSKKVFEGDTARLECQISAIPTPRIYWKRNNEMVQYNTDRIRYPTAQLAVGVLQTATSVCSIRCKWAALCKEQAGSWVCPGVWHRGHGPCAESLALGTQRDRAVPRAALSACSSRGPLEKHSFRNEMCSVGLHTDATCMVPRCNQWWLWHKCRARVWTVCKDCSGAFSAPQHVHWLCFLSFPFKALRH